MKPDYTPPVEMYIYVVSVAFVDVVNDELAVQTGVYLKKKKSEFTLKSCNKANC